jgi:inward rectifier potassium channel
MVSDRASGPHWRLLNRDGSFNVKRSSQSQRPKVRDHYHKLLAMKWSPFMALVICIYLAVNLTFALGYMACGPEALDGAPHLIGGSADSFLQAFFFSVQTFATIGYGKISPEGLLANILVTIEAFVGLLGLALITGLFFARFSRPTARVVFSDVAIIAPHDGVMSLVLRIANERLNQIVDATLTLVFSRNEVTIEGERYRQFYDLKLERARSPIFALSWTVVHPITKESPLYGATNEDLIRWEAEFMASLIGIDDTIAQTIHARYSYTPSEIVWNHHFVDMTHRENGMVRIDAHLIHDTIPQPFH